PTETATVNVTISAVADAVNDTASTSEDTPVNGDASTNDTFSGPKTYSLGTGPAHGMAVVNADGTFTYTPAADYNGTDSFTYNVANAGPTETATVNVTISAVNDAPTINSTLSLTTSEDFGPKNFSGSLSFSDVDAGSATVTVVLDALHGVLNVLGSS